VRVPSPYEVINTECIAAEVDMVNRTNDETERKGNGEADVASLHPGYERNHYSWLSPRGESG